MEKIRVFVIGFTIMVSTQTLAECKITKEYSEARKEATEIVYGSNNSYSKCVDAAHAMEYWLALSRCEESGDGKHTGGGCAP